MAQKQGTLLENVSQLRPDLVEALRPFWITTLEELVSTAYEEKGRQGLADLLKMAPDAVQDMAHDLLPLVADEIREQIGGGVRAFGLGSLDKLERGGSRGLFDRLPVPEVLPERVSLVSRLPAIRNQGVRGTCVAHACTAVREFLMRDTHADLSEQFLYWAARQKLMTPILKDRPGLLLMYGMSALQESGICAEADWRYNPDTLPGNETQGPPPPDAAAKAQAYRIQRHVFIWPRDIHAVKAHLAGDYAVAVTIPTWNIWGAVMTNWAGTVRLPFTTEGTLSPIVRLETAHAVCLAGYQDDPTVPGGGYFIVRNSWGTEWAKQSPDNPGYGWLPYDYVRRYGLTAFTAV